MRFAPRLNCSSSLIVWENTTVPRNVLMITVKWQTRLFSRLGSTRYFALERLHVIEYIHAFSNHKVLLFLQFPFGTSYKRLNLQGIELTPDYLCSHNCGTNHRCVLSFPYLVGVFLCEYTHSASRFLFNLR